MVPINPKTMLLYSCKQQTLLGVALSQSSNCIFIFIFIFIIILIFNPILLRLGGLLKGVLVCLEAAQSPVVGHLGYFSLARRPLSLLHGRIHLSEALRFVHDAPQRELVGRTQLAIL